MNEQGFAWVLVVSAMAMALSLLLTVGRDQKASGLRFWALGLLVSPLGWLLYRYASSEATVVLAVLGKALIALGMTLYLRALVLLGDRRQSSSSWFYWIPAAVVVLSVLHVVVWPEKPLGSGLLSMICSGLAVVSGVQAWRLNPLTDARSHGRVLALNFCVIAVFSMLRAGLLLTPEGSLFAAPMTHALSQDWLVALMVLAPIVGTVNLAMIERDQLTNHYRNLAQVDSLTGAATRSHIIETLSARFEAARREHHALAVLVIDLDHFKTVNDQHGHDVGDLVLRHVVHLIQSDLPPSATLGRIGGEEFLVVLEGTSMEYALDLAEQLRSSVENQPTFHEGIWLRSTISIGCAVRMADDHGFSDLVRRADQAMYAAKQSGRNRASQIFQRLRKDEADSAVHSLARSK
ncbi:MAG TPA: GGDEF domain-containing protein [Dokdonella sp.]|uniref:GGDEF domain-containing protein n=1 Tax=Dokdonella sp. TaxID=2291710 RepID=UPI002D80A4A6|nr:GGDEF domain-containing protein [Dokdonella sp.]HET9031468.1 GGDEF domain-containing protein [Dokdonella sp.]